MFKKLSALLFSFLLVGCSSGEGVFGASPQTDALDTYISDTILASANGVVTDGSSWEADFTRQVNTPDGYNVQEVYSIPVIHTTDALGTEQVSKQRVHLYRNDAGAEIVRTADRPVRNYTSATDSFAAGMAQLEAMKAAGQIANWGPVDFAAAHDRTVFTLEIEALDGAVTQYFATTSGGQVLLVPKRSAQ